MPSKCALFWDESFLWGLITYRSLKSLGLAFTLVNSEDIKSGKLTKFKALLVPGGWASNKAKALGEEGAEEIKRFVRDGGIYIGICGGAGLATSEGLGLLAIKRRPLMERAPSVSGLVSVEVSPHPLWRGIKKPFFHIWWPSQFVVQDPSINIIARFRSATEETFTSDLNAFDIQNGDAGKSWDEVETEYGLNLNPARMEGDPLVLHGQYGKGGVFLSLVHFETSSSASGARALKNLWDNFGLEKRAPENFRGLPVQAPFVSPLEELFSFGLRNFLWFERAPLIQWRRGVRGLEYFTLLEMAKELARRAGGRDRIEPLSDEVKIFCDKGRRLLLHERLALQRGEAITFSRASSPEMHALRTGLFGTIKSHGGEFKALLDRLDSALYKHLK